ncbi:MAG TPA: DUF1080 domain-containing protein [Gemmatimonadaceae bacterium]|nr:DUF1080 domain-containing protein [Gemmatimonadaceae bacterium]
MPNIRVPNVIQASLSRTAIALLLAGAAALAGCKTTPSQMRPAPSDGTASQAPNQLSEAERAAGWRLLFDGRTLTGWRGLGYTGVPTAHWTVENGAIKKIASGNVAVQADGQPVAGGDLMTDATYRDFELAWDWKVTPGANSGIKYNVSEELSTAMPPSHAAKGFEYQMLDDDRHADGKLPTHRAGALYDLIAPNANKRLNPVGEWNHSVIVFDGNHGEHWLNGQKVVGYELESPAMKAALAASKYAPIAWFATRRAGHIVLQDHGDEVYFRNLKIRELHATR